jgi:hypothetical protein
MKRESGFVSDFISQNGKGFEEAESGLAFLKLQRSSTAKKK